MSHPKILPACNRKTNKTNTAFEHLRDVRVHSATVDLHMMNDSALNLSLMMKNTHAKIMKKLSFYNSFLDLVHLCTLRTFTLYKKTGFHIFIFIFAFIMNENSFRRSVLLV